MNFRNRILHIILFKEIEKQKIFSELLLSDLSSNGCVIYSSSYRRISFMHSMPSGCKNHARPGSAKIINLCTKLTWYPYLLKYDERSFIYIMFWYESRTCNIMKNLTQIDCRPSPNMIFPIFHSIVSSVYKSRSPILKFSTQFYV